MATNDDNTRNLLNLLPLEVLERCLKPFETEFAEPDGLRKSGENLNLDSDILSDIVNSGDELPLTVRQISLETTYRNVCVKYCNDVNRLFDIFDDDEDFGPKVRLIVMPNTFLKNRPASAPRSKFPSSPPKTRKSSAPPSGSPTNDSAVEESDNVDIPAMLATPLARQLVYYIESLITTHLVGRLPATITDNVRSVWNWTEQLIVHCILVPRLLRSTPGLKRLNTWGNGIGMVPAISSNDADDTNNSSGLKLVELESMTIGQHFYDSLVPFCYLDINGLLMRCAPNLKELQLSMVHRVVRTSGCMKRNGTGNDQGASGTVHDDKNVTPASLAKLESLTLFDCKFANKDLDCLMDAVPRPASYGVPGLQKFDAVVNLLGTEGDLEHRNHDNKEYLNGVVTCYDTVHSLLHWKDTLKSLRLVHGCHETGYAHLMYAWECHLNSALRKEDKRLLLGTSLLPEFTGLKELTISAHLFDLMYINPYIEKYERVVRENPRRETTEAARRRIVDSIANYLPPNLERLTLLRPIPHKNAESRWVNTRETVAEGFDGQRVQHNLDKYSSPVIPLSALVYLVKTKFKYPKLVSTTDTYPPDARFNPPQTTMPYSISDNRTLSVTCLEEDKNMLFPAIQHMGADTDIEEPANRIYTEKIWR